MRRLCSFAVFVAALAACDRPTAIVMCHNANCDTPIDPSLDDTLEGLNRSLELSYRGRPTIDGLDFDTFWSRPHGQCLFAHSVPSEIGLTAMEVADRIAVYLATEGEISYNGELFYMNIELKGFVDCLGCPHEPAEVTSHVECVLDMLDVFEQAAIDNDRRLEISLDSTEARLLRVLADDTRWTDRDPGGPVELRLSADFSDPTSTGLIVNPKIEEFAGVELDNVVLHPAWLNYGHYETFKSMELDISMWMFQATAENFGAIDRIEPRYVITSEAELMRRWLEY